ncbi:sodium:solute symporter [Spirochaetia bacterium]|nr:sodium:solute symporter [Spirochaetia bacterium]
MTLYHYIGAALILVFITVIGLYSGKRVKSANDFSGGSKKAGAGIVTGSIIGTLVGGASTIGTAQLAFNYGFSAWWFTLGAGLGCLTLGLFFAKPLYESGIQTLPEVFSREFGRRSGVAATVLTSVGSFLSIVSQVLSGIALVAVVGGMDRIPATFLTIALMLVYVVFGGVWGAGMVGIAKTLLMYAGLGICLVAAVAFQGGFGAFTLPGDRYFNLFARGLAVDLGAGLSLVLGVLTTQTYIQAAISAKSLRASRIGIFLSAVLIPIMGIPGIYVGMYMKLHRPDVPSASVMPLFILENLPPVVAGMILAVLLVALVGTGAGISLGISSMFVKDIYKQFINKNPGDKRTLVVSRLVIVVVLLAAALFTFGDMGSLILGWSFMSMGLRGAVAFVPLCAVLFFPGKIARGAAFISMLVSPVLVLIGKLLINAGLMSKAIDPLFPAIGGSVLIFVVGYVYSRKHPATPTAMPHDLK